MTAADLPHTAYWKHAVHLQRPRLRRWALVVSELPGHRERRDRENELIEIFSCYWGWLTRYDRGDNMPLREDSYCEVLPFAAPGTVG